jgi:hypothetical protein
MTTLREAAQQALEAMEPMQNNRDDTAIQRAITALRAALPCTYKCEAWPECACATLAQQDDPHPPSRHCMCDACKPAFEPTPGPEQEPVAWRSQNATPPGGFVIFQQYPQALADLGGKIEPLYTAPPRREWQGLTEEEIEDMAVNGTNSELRRRQFARAVEAALKEKNHG